VIWGMNMLICYFNC